MGAEVSVVASEANQAAAEARVVGHMDTMQKPKLLTMLEALDQVHDHQVDSALDHSRL